MDQSQNVLLVTNGISPQNVQSIRRAIEGMETDVININAAFIIPPIPAAFHQIPSINGVQHNIYEDAENQLANISESLEIPLKNRWLSSGPITSEARKLAQQINADLIIMENIAKESFFERCLAYMKSQFGPGQKQVPFVHPDKSKRALVSNQLQASTIH